MSIQGDRFIANAVAMQPSEDSFLQDLPQSMASAECGHPVRVSPHCALVEAIDVALYKQRCLYETTKCSKEHKHCMEQSRYVCRSMM